MLTKTIKVRLTESEHKKAKDYAARCGLSMNALIRILCGGLVPQPMPSENFWRLMDELGNVCIEYGNIESFDGYYKERSKVIEMLIVDLQESMTVPREVAEWRQQACGTLMED